MVIEWFIGSLPNRDQVKQRVITEKKKDNFAHLPNRTFSLSLPNNLKIFSFVTIFIKRSLFHCSHVHILLYSCAAFPPTYRRNKLDQDVGYVPPFNRAPSSERQCNGRSKNTQAEARTCTGEVSATLSRCCFFSGPE